LQQQLESRGLAVMTRHLAVYILASKNESLSDSDKPPTPELIAAEEAALEQFREILADVRPNVVEAEG
jgi:hypothetical protein